MVRSTTIPPPVGMADPGRQPRRACARGGLPQRRPVRRRCACSTNSVSSAARPAAYVLALLSRLTMPVVTTLHTVLAEPTAAQRAVLERIVEASSQGRGDGSQEAANSCAPSISVPDHKIEVIAHGIPDVAFVLPRTRPRPDLGPAGGRSVIPTFGLLCSQQGHRGRDRRHAGDPSKRRPDAVYVVLGATHPNLVRDQVARPIARALTSARARARRRGPRGLPWPVLSIRPRCSTSFRCATSTSPPTSTRRR